jgi:hypothetical protein
LSFHARHRAENTHTFILLRSLDGAVSFRWHTGRFPDVAPLGGSSRWPDPSERHLKLPGGVYYSMQRRRAEDISYNSSWEQLGFQLKRSNPQKFELGILAIPHWILLFLFLLLPFVLLRSRIRTYMRHYRGLCLTCGYDLRSTPNLCPECGHCRQPTSAAAV